MKTSNQKESTSLEFSKYEVARFANTSKILGGGGDDQTTPQSTAQCIPMPPPPPPPKKKT